MGSGWTGGVERCFRSRGRWGAGWNLNRKPLSSKRGGTDMRDLETTSLSSGRFLARVLSLRQTEKGRHENGTIGIDAARHAAE